MKKYKVILNIIIPIIVLIILFFSTLETVLFKFLDFSYFPLSFSAVISIFNYNYKKRSFKFYDFILNFMISYICFLITIFLVFGLSLFNTSKEFINTYLIHLIIFLLSPIIVLRSFYLFYDIKFTFFTKALIIMTSIFLYFYSLQEIPFDLNMRDSSYKHFLIWQVCIVFSLQVVLYRKELKNIINYGKD
jgi:hypothetical protein